MVVPDGRLMGREVIEPDREHVFLDARIIEALAAPVGQDHQVEPHSDGDDPLDRREVRVVLARVHRTAQQDQLANLKPAVGREHHHAAAVTVPEEVETLQAVGADPGQEIDGAERPCAIAVAARPAEAVA